MEPRISITDIPLGPPLRMESSQMDVTARVRRQVMEHLSNIDASFQHFETPEMPMRIGSTAITIGMDSQVSMARVELSSKASVAQD